MLRRSDYKIDIPVLNPLTEEYGDLWEREYQRIIEGHWVGNVYMTGPMYFYTNHWHIELTNEKTKTRVIGSPDIRDIEFRKFYTYLVAKGFSGFEEDAEFHCNHKLRDSDNRVFLEPMKYLYKVHKKALGRPLYDNNMLNIIEIGCRGYGKTFSTSGLIYHNFITDGIKNINEALDAIEEYNNPFANKSISIFGAIDTKYSNKVLNAFNIGVKYLKGGYKLGDEFFPPPFSRRTSGTLKAGGAGLFNEWKEKEGNNDVIKGTGSSIHHVTFFNNPHAANGFRNSLCILDEIGFFDGLLETWGQLKECTSTDKLKMGVIWALGTGGDMKGGSTEAAKEVFYHPEDYDCISFADEWENKGSCGLFIPRTMVMGSEFKDEFGNSLYEKASKSWEEEFSKQKKATDQSVVDGYLQNNPIKPSHAFLVLEGNRYPTAQIQEQLDSLDILPKAEFSKLAIVGTLESDHLDNITFKPDLDNRLRDCGYPILKDNKKGCVTIYEMPDIKAEPFTYVAGLDPIGTEGPASEIQSNSIASCVIVRRGLFGRKIVAEYAGRETELNDTNEIMRKLLVFYNAHCLYENNYNNFKLYLQGKLQLHYLAKTPNVLKASVGRSDSYGLHATKEGNKEMVKHLSDWLLSKAPNGETVIKGINSKSILKELISAGDEVNTDRETALKLAIVLGLQLDLNTKKEEIQTDYFDYFSKRYDKDGHLIRR